MATSWTSMRTGLATGEELCFDCPLPDCNDNHPQCPRQQWQAAWREMLGEQMGAALGGIGEFAVVVREQSMRRSITATARVLAPDGVHVSTECGPVGREYWVRVELRRDPDPGSNIAGAIAGA